MSVNYILSQYMDTAMSQATYDQLEDGTFGGLFHPAKGLLHLHQNYGSAITSYVQP